MNWGREGTVIFSSLQTTTEPSTGDKVVLELLNPGFYEVNILMEKTDKSVIKQRSKSVHTIILGSDRHYESKIRQSKKKNDKD